MGTCNDPLAFHGLFRYFSGLNPARILDCYQAGADERAMGFGEDEWRDE